LIKLTNEMRDLVNNARESGNPSIVTTASHDGIPNSGYIGTVLTLDEGSFVYRDRSGRTPLEHIEENPKVVLLFRHSEQELGWKFRCTACVHREGPIYEDSIKRLFESGLITDPEAKTAVVVLQVNQVLTLFGEVLQEREPGHSW